MKFFSCVLLLMLCGLGQVAYAGPMTINDGGFEGLATGVSLFAPSTTIRGAWILQNQARISATGGNPGQAMDLESGGSILSDPLIYQDVTGLTVGATYNVSWDLRVAVNYAGFANGPSFGVFLDSQTFSSALYLGGTLSTTYVPLSASFIATGATQRLIFAGELDSRTNGAGNTDVSYFIDNVAFSASSAVPEPTTITLLGIGVTCLVLRRRSS